MNQKVELTKYIINKLNLISPNEKSFKSWIHVIWQNPRIKTKGGLRLTDRGFDLISKTDIKYFELLSPENNLPAHENKFILWLDNNFKSPFYITRTKIFVFDEWTAVQLVLFSGDILQYYNAQQKFLEKQDSN